MTNLELVTTLANIDRFLATPQEAVIEKLLAERPRNKKELCVSIGWNPTERTLKKTREEIISTYVGYEISKAQDKRKELLQELLDNNGGKAPISDRHYKHLVKHGKLPKSCQI